MENGNFDVPGNGYEGTRLGGTRKSGQGTLEKGGGVEYFYVSCKTPNKFNL